MIIVASNDDWKKNKLNQSRLLLFALDQAMTTLSLISIKLHEVHMTQS
jgi:hypothetical protein